MKCHRTLRAVSGTLLLTGYLGASPSFAAAEPKFGTRSPRTCAEIKNVPTIAQAVALIQCHQEHKSERDITLIENVRIQMGGPQPYNYKAHSHLTAIDTTSRVYPIRGSYRLYGCDVAQAIPVIHSDNRGKNCWYVEKTAASGSCWKTTFGSWDCSIVDTTNNDPIRDQPPPPQ